MEVLYAISGELKYQPEKQSRRDACDDSRERLKYRGDAFDNYIRSSDILDAEKYPEIVFKSTK